MRQDYLKIWKDDYSFPWFIGNNIDLYNNLLNFNGQVIISGPKFSGKKHLVFEILKKKDGQLFFTNFMQNIQIISEYEKAKTNNDFVLWVYDDSYEYSQDVISRFFSMPHFKIKEIDDEFFFSFLKMRLERIGIFLDENLMHYALLSLKRTYYDIHMFILFVSSKNKITLKVLKEFFEKK